MDPPLPGWARPAFPRSAAYDPAWALANHMGPNALWLAEALIPLGRWRPGMRVLDLGCGRAMSSIFLARELSVQVWATDLWIAAADNASRIQAAGLADQVFPIHAEAHQLPFAPAFFDAIISLDAYHYFGTDDLYLGYLAPFLKPGGQLSIVVPGLAREFAVSGLPIHLQPFWQWEFWSFHSPAWWRNHWAKTGLVIVETADLIPDGWQHWLAWLEFCASHASRSAPEEAAMLQADAGRNLGLVRLTAYRPAATPG